jgi:hypothetical protein
MGRSLDSYRNEKVQNIYKDLYTCRVWVKRIKAMQQGLKCQHAEVVRSKRAARKLFLDLS